MNPYETLGVPPDADKAAIKRAAKRKMHKHHPDKGGDAAEFKRINSAKRLLCDDTARKRYDETGSTEDRSEEMTDEQHAIAILGKIFIALLEKDEHGGDLIYAMQVEIAKGMREGPQIVANQKRKIAKAEKVLKKYLKQKGGKPAYLQNCLVAHLAVLNKQLEQMELAQRIGPLMLGILKDYSWEGPPPNPFESGDLTIDHLIKMSRFFNNTGT